MTRQGFHSHAFSNEEGIDMTYAQQPNGKYDDTPRTSTASSPDASSGEVSPNPSFGSSDGHLRRPDPMPSRDRATSDDQTINTSMTGNTTTRLVKLVKQQVSMVKNLTSANVEQNAELERVRQEKLRMEEDYRRMQQELEAAKRSGKQNGGYRPNRERGTSLDSISEKHVGWSDRDLGQRGLPPPPPRGASDNISVATPYTVDTPYMVDAPVVEMYDKQGLGPKASFDRHNRGRQSSEDSVSVDAFSTAVFPSARDLPRAEAVTAVPAKKSRSWRRKSKRGGGRSDPPPQPRTTKYAAPLPEKTREDGRLSCASQLWVSFAFMCTFFIPNFLICKSGPGAKQAWREKVAICVIVVLVSAFFVGLFGFIPLFFCTETDTYTWQDIWAKDREAWTVVHGTIYDMKNFANVHPGGSEGVLDFLGKDSSKLFPRTPPANLPAKCLNAEKDLDNFSQWTCQDFTDVDKLVDLHCHSDQSKARNGVDKWLGEYKAGTLAYSASSLRNDRDFDWIVIKDKVYNVTNYVNGLKDENSNMIEKDPEESDNAYLTEKLHSLIVNKLNEDATELYEKLYANDDFIDCLNELFYVGIVDDRYNPACQTLNIAMYVMLIFVAAILVLQCICSLLYLARSHHAFTKEDTGPYVMCMVPCYNEGDKELRKTINSVIDTEYPHDNKVMLVVADGNITGRGESKSTPETLANILGFEINKYEDESYEYRSIGALRENRANVYSGTYEKGGKQLKYIVIVKCGVESEADSGRAGNRGKRDSQLIVMGLFNRVHYEREPCDLDKAISRALNGLEIPAHELQYLMAIDADTRVEKDSMSHMVYNMNKNESILALCGETRVDNKAQSIITMLQVFEYYTNHHMKKAFESVFGCVTCLPGCFTMYRVTSNDGRSLLAQDNVFSEYARNDIESLHEKNLYHLGEDRMLTTLLLKTFPDMRLSFVPEAACWTIVPHTFSVLLSQRRRWINSTFHNMWELLKVKTMCGICCFSMKTIVVLDMIATMVLPASMIYAGYFIYLVFVTGEEMSMLMIILYGVIFGVQILIFLLRSRWDYLFWFLVFIICGMPLFYFILPLYSFMKMDDFSWGTTRQVSKENKAAPPSSSSQPREASRNQSRSRDAHHSQPKRSGERSSGERRPSNSRPSTRSSSRADQEAERIRRVRKDAERRRRREAQQSAGRHSRQSSADMGEC